MYVEHHVVQLALGWGESLKNMNTAALCYAQGLVVLDELGCVVFAQSTAMMATVTRRVVG
jgi:hypothetical protein